MFMGSFAVYKAPGCVTLYLEARQHATFSHFKSSLGVYHSLISVTPPIIGYTNYPYTIHLNRTTTLISMKEVQGYLGMDRVGQGGNSGES